MVVLGGGGVFYRSNDWHLLPEMVAADMNSTLPLVRLTAVPIQNRRDFGLVWPSFDVLHRTGAADRSLFVFMPFWLLFVGAALPTFLILVRDRRPRAGVPCNRCEYDLKGNVTGICPECGTPIPEEVRKEIAAKEENGKTAS